MFAIDKELEELFIDKIKTVLIQGETSKKTVTTSDETYRFRIDDNGRETPYEKIVNNKTVRTISLLPVPTWILKAISDSLSVESAIALLQKNGYVVVDPTETTKQDKNVDNTVFINRMKAELLGINRNNYKQLTE